MDNSQRPFNPLRFKMARQLARQSQKDLARFLGVPELRVQHWEAGRSVPSMEVLEQISQQFGQVMPGFFFMKDPPHFPMGSLLIHEMHGYRRYDDWNEDEQPQTEPVHKLRITSKHL